MNFDEILSEHLLDRPVYHLAQLGPVSLNITRHSIFLWIAAAVTTLIMAFAARGRGRAAQLLRHGVEAVILYIREDMLHPMFHDATDYYLPYFLTLFFFILTANLIGLIPEASAVTANISVTAGLAFCTFGLIQFAGAREQGPVTYFMHIVPGGVPWWLWPMLLLIEIGGMIAKAVALCIRLFANIISGHIVSLAFLSLIFIFAAMNKWLGLAVSPAAVGLALFAVTLDVLVALLQAYIFTILTAVFVSGAVHPH